MYPINLIQAYFLVRAESRYLPLCCQAGGEGGGAGDVDEQRQPCSACSLGQAGPWSAGLEPQHGMAEGGGGRIPSKHRQNYTFFQQLTFFFISYYIRVDIFLNLVPNYPMNISLFSCYSKFNIKGDPLPRPALVVRIIHYMYQKYAVIMIQIRSKTLNY